ncbi:hypothetical protein D9619_007710 [Psilocybe cf. subviscida]|uniref:Nephrocystin 3-like N-terminal domain-containing protein n=1 Tax=Psilocybe cf. subviscida TaxID=2480587 RepID=A0A8H5AVN3_9AGAR|nr:hypothetical protein D9619_007710 [Psilocybe cf. subviscida]
MSVLLGATNTTINNGYFTAVSTTNIGAQTHDIVALLHSQSATAGLLDAKERFDAPKCDEGTRTSMILGMKKFVQDGDAASSPALYWLHGPAGVGKSALAQSLSLELKSEGNHAASFFFSRTSPERNNGNQLIVTVAYQLATVIPELQYYMSDVVKTNPAILAASNAVQMQSLIIDPINKWQGEYIRRFCRWVYRTVGVNEKPHPRLILVDGLDECNDRNVQRDLIICIASAVRQLSIPFRFVIASRPESHLLATFELDPAFQGHNGVKVTKKNPGDDEDADEHITTFLLKEFAEIRRAHPIRDFLPREWPRPDQIEQLVSKSSKGFIYPATVIRYIKMDHSRPDKCLEQILGLSTIPTYDKPYEPLDCLYRHIFESVPDINKTSIHEIFHFLVVPSTWDGVTTPAMIERHFNYMPGHVQHVLRDLLCLVAFNHDGPIKVLHASLPDFFLDQSRSGPLYIDVGDAHTTIAAAYLLYICHSDELPSLHSGFGDFLEHMLHANVSDTLIRHRIPKMDLLSQYRKVYIRLRIGDTTIRLSGADVEGIAFMVAYLLALVIQCGPQKYIRDQIAAIKAYVLEKYPFAASVHTMHSMIIPAMTPLFRKWTSTIHHECINRIFSCEVDPSQNSIREAIFELHLLMIAPLCREVIRTWIWAHYVPTEHHLKEPGQRTKEEPNYWARIIQGGNHCNQIPPSLPTLCSN